MSGGRVGSRARRPRCVGVRRGWGGGGGRHRRVKGLLDAVAVMNVDVDVEHALVVLQQLEDGEHDVVGVAEAARLALLGVVEAARPIDRYVGVPFVELHRAADRPAGRGLAELVEAVEDGAVLAHVEPLHLLRVLAHVVGRDRAQEADVVLGVEFAQLLERRRARPVDLHLAVEAVVEQQVVRHPDAVRLHRVALAVVVVADLRRKEGGVRGARRRRRGGSGQGTRGGGAGRAPACDGGPGAMKHVSKTHLTLPTTAYE